MKKLATTLLWAFGSLHSYALPLGNPSEPSLFANAYIECLSCDWFKCCGISNFSAGYYGDFVFNRYLGNKLPAVMRQTELITNAGFLSVNFWDRVDLFGTLGTSTIYLHGFGSAFSITPGFDLNTRFHCTVESKRDFSWSVGVRSDIFKYCCFGIGAEAQYFRTTPDVNFFTDYARVLVYPDDISMKYSEWQVGAGAYYDMKFECTLLSSLVPYIGVKWARAHLDMGNTVITPPPGISIRTATLFNLKSRRDFGFAVGLTAVACDRLGLTVEGRFGDERAIYVNGQLRF